MRRRGMRRTSSALLVIAVVASGCSSEAKTDGRAANSGSSRTSTGAAPVRAAAHGSCDDADPSACLLPWPNDRFTRADPSAATGRRVDLPATGTPANSSGTRIDPTEWNRNDGFAPASTLITHVDDLDVQASELPPVTDIESSLGSGSSLVIIDGRTEKRVAAWAELDANAHDPDRQALLITPAAGLAEGTTYYVGLRHLKHTDGTEVKPSKTFAGRLAHPDRLSARVFQELEDHAGVTRTDLDIAWSFTVGSTESISGRLRSMWSETSKDLGDGAPPFEVTSDEASGPARVVQGTFEMPNYLTGDGGPGSVLANGDDPDGIPIAHGTMKAAFFCTVPEAASAAKPAGTVIYGHGLLGTRAQALDIGLVGASVNLSFCALDYLGMSADDVASIVKSFKDLSEFRSLPDRLQQGHLGFLLLGRLLRSPQGFASDKAFQDHAGKAILDAGHVSLLGASQGGILGGVASALTNDWQQVILAVPGMGYNLLLRRSVDFDEFFPAVEASYPDELDQPILLDLLEQLWQRGENSGYAEHLTRDPYPGVKAKHVLLLEAFGDHQVANVSTEKLARTLRIGRQTPTLADGRSSDATPFWGIDPIPKLPSSGSGLVMWDFDTPMPPIENLPNRAGDDPHGKLSDVPEALALVLSFVTDGKLIDVCGGKPCHSPG
ncbi:MAG: hypothetical protein JWM89_3752 [Acidimicrobiales bacterium]|nr:hypothetical protein [Acidimicrobiales bacterium]